MYKKKPFKVKYAKICFKKVMRYIPQYVKISNQKNYNNYFGQKKTC